MEKLPKINKKENIKKAQVNIPKTYGPNKFQITPLEGKIKAMSLDPSKDSKDLIKALTENIENFHKEIAIPRSSDWLWEHVEKGLSYKVYITGINTSPSKSHNVIYIQNLDNNMEESFLTDRMLEHMRILLELYYPPMKAKLNPDNSSLETLKIDNRNNYYLQYHAGQAIEKVTKLIPKDGLIIIGLTSYDIYPREEWNFVFGLADKMSGCGIFSFKRYYEELKSQYEGEELQLQVTKLAGKVMLHEVGHLFGLPH
jgi:archaemetzincin